ncbi:hypothetical protein U9M48_018249 [Paspalum notatum var. saurae]|uniref:Uncharacterized protein n=1 Tax=Paspalum notatum var. saurae TaxID=547442 RepID=A0AAQ3T9S2_PASNO
MFLCSPWCSPKERRRPAMILPWGRRSWGKGKGPALAHPVEQRGAHGELAVAGNTREPAAAWRHMAAQAQATPHGLRADLQSTGSKVVAVLSCKGMTKFVPPMAGDLKTPN